jgi:hypothetical protein
MGLRRVAIDLVWASWMTSVECNTGVMAEDEKRHRKTVIPDRRPAVTRMALGR